MAIDYAKFPNLHPSVQMGRSLPRRSAFVQFYEGDENGEPRGKTPIKTLDGLNIKFSVEENFGDIYPTGTISICNASRETRDFLTNYMNFKDLQFSKRVIRLYAGYLQEGQSAKDTPYIFGGNVMYSRFSEPPDIWINLEVLYKRIASALKRQEWTYPGVANAQQILTKCAEVMKVGLDIRDMPPKSVTNFTASGDGKRLLRELRNTYLGYAIFISTDNKLTVVKVDRDQPNRGETIWSLREDTGLIGMPVVEYQGIEATTLLNPEMKPGDWVHLVSKNQPSADGLYRIIRLTHTGELRGNEFCTKIHTAYPHPDKGKK